MLSLDFINPTELATNAREVIVGRATLLAAALATLLPSLPFHIKGQSVPTTVIRDQPTCPRCNFQLTELARISTQDGPGFIGIPNSMVRDSRGRMYVASHVFRGETKVYNPDGSFLRTITKRGGGPGEVSSGANLLVMEGDTVYVFDPGSFRVNVFGPEHQLVRELNVPLLRNFDATQTGGQLVVAAAKTVNGIWTTLHLVTPAGVIIRSFGTPTVQLSSNAEFLLWRYVIPNRDGKSIWAAPKFGDYHFEKWSLSGKAEQLFVRQAPWFKPAGTYAVNQWRPGTPPPALIAAMREDSLGRLWFITGVPKGNWKSITTANPRAGQHLTFDAWLEVIDPERAVVIARQRLAVHALGFLGGDLYAYEEDESGIPSVRIFRLELHQPPTNGGYE